MNTEQERTDLLPCPFCGESKSLIVQHCEGTIIHPAYRIYCGNCGASSGYADRVDPAKYWNSRAAIEADRNLRGEPVAWSYEYHDFGDVWVRHAILNRPDGGANPPTKHHGSPIRNVVPLFANPVVKDSLTVEPVAWAVFADNGNIRIWCADPIQAETLKQQYGNQLKPLYDAPQPAEPSGAPTLHNTDSGAQNENQAPQPAHYGQPCPHCTPVDGKHGPRVQQAWHAGWDAAQEARDSAKAVPDALIPTAPDYDYLAEMAGNVNLPMHMRANLAAVVQQQRRNE